MAGFFGLLDFVGYPLYGLSILGSAISTWVGTERYLPINYIPRWMSPNYDPNSTLRKIYALGPIYHRDFLYRLGELDFMPSFWGETWQPRAAYVAKYAYPKNYIPKIELVTALSHVEQTHVWPVATTRSLRFENTRPVSAQDHTNIYLRNLSLVTFQATVVSGLVNMASAFFFHPILEDSFLVVENQYGEETFYDQWDPMVYGNYVPVRLLGPVKVRYLSKTLHNQLIAGTSYITIDGEKISIRSHQLENVWDQYAALCNIQRRANEDNVSLKTRCQHLSILKNPESLISAALGQTRFILWATTTPLTLTGSGFVRAEVFGLEKTQPIEENPAKIGSNFALRYNPETGVQVFLRTIPLPSNTYTVSGNLIVPTYDKLGQASTQEVFVKYRASNYTETTASDFLTALTHSGAREFRWVIGVKNVRVRTGTKKIREWRWNKETGVKKGTASFN